MRHPLPYHPELGAWLRALAQPDQRAVWLRPAGSLDMEIFSAFPIMHCNDLEQGKLPGQAAVPSYLEDLPFRGGHLGYISYDGGGTPPLPSVYLGLYPHFIHIDHHRRTAEEVRLPGFPAPAEEWGQLLAASLQPPAAAAFALTGTFQPLTSPDRYRRDFQRIQHYLHQGDCYQVNYAQAFRAGCQGSSAAAMDRLLAVSNPAYAAWLSLPEGEILSLSPELFLRVEAGRITTKPIKGTAPRSADPVRDAQLREELQASPKNRAENLMIVDLLRHDISQHAETGSVQVEKLFEVETLPQVHHLVSTIRANLKKESQSIDLIKDCFPGGSITGAPKKRAMEIIAELEPTPRSIYCGSIGYLNLDGSGQFNIAIRTLLRQGDHITAWAGGGIVADSDCDAEYQECFDKIGALMRALEDMGPA
ncbi:MAG TPA: aminodeoxychorismate synthase component I [Moraxellaceae bacterium]